MLFSQIIQQNAHLVAQHCPINNQVVEFDQPFFNNIKNAFSFIGCEITVVTGSPFMSVSLATNQGIQFENCTFRIGVCIWGQSDGAMYLPLNQIGPNVFFDNCKAEMFTYMGRNAFPQIQISGFISHARVCSQVDNPLSLIVSQCNFSKLEIVGSFTSFQLVDYKGNYLLFRNSSFSSLLWFREKLLSEISSIEFDMKSILNISNWTKNSTMESNEINSSIKMILEVLANNKEGAKFLILNDAFCTYLSKTKGERPDLSVKILYGFFRNFYSLRPWFVIAALITILFSIAYFNFDGISIKAALLNSVFAFSGNPSNVKDMNVLYNLLGAIEAFIGIFYVIVFSFVFTRKYSNYV